MIRIWDRYFLIQYLKAFFLFIFCFYGLYILIDYTSRLHAIQSLKLSVLEIIYYYGLMFLLRMDILVSFGIIIATVYVLTTLNLHNELIALLASGVTKKRLLLPFVIMGFVFTGLLYVNVGFFMPRAIQQLNAIEESRQHSELIGEQTMLVQSTILEDQSILLFQRYHAQQALFSDLYWIRSADDIYHMKQLANPISEPIGYQVDHLQRNAKGLLAVAESFDKKDFSNMRFNKQKLLESLISPQQYTLIQLWNKLPSVQSSLTDREAQILTLFYRRLVMPWLCLLAILAPAPFCMVFTRRLPTFLLYSCSIFGLIAFYLLMNAATVIGETQTLPPLIAIATPCILVYGSCMWKYAKL